MNKHATHRKDTNILPRGWVFGIITNNPIRVNPLTVECVNTAMINGNGFKVRSLTGCFGDISEIVFGRIMSTLKTKGKVSEGNKGNEHVFNPMVNVRSKLCHVAQYPIINIREVHIPLHLGKQWNGSRHST